jgi:nitrate reductase NapAB chaperone NapD
VQHRRVAPMLHRRPENSMIVAGVVIQTIPGRQADVIARLVDVPGLQIKGGDGRDRIAAVWSAESAHSLEEIVESLVEIDEDVIGVYPTFVGEDEG